MNEGMDSAATIERASTVSAHTGGSPPGTIPARVAWNARKQEPPFFCERHPT